MGNCKSTPIRPPADEKNSLLSPHQLNNASDSQPAGLDNAVVEEPVGALPRDIHTDSGEAISANNNSLSRITEISSSRDGSISSTAAVIFSRKSSKGQETHEKSNETLDVSSHSNSNAPKAHASKHHHNYHHHRTKQAIQQDPQWTQLFRTLSPYLLDPEDLPATLDSIISRMINRLSPVEISFIRRRVRDVSASILNSNDGGGGDGNSLGGGGGGGGSSSRPSFSGHMAKVGRLVGAVSSNHVGNNSSHHDKSSSTSLTSLSSFHPALEEGHGKSSSKALFQKERLLDIAMVRKVFEGGERRLKALQQAGGMGVNVKPENVDEINSPTAVNTNGTDEKVFEKEKKTSRRKSFTKTPSVQTPEETSIFPPKPEDLDRMALEKIDVYGSAFLLLIYMSEKRWDFITEISKLSAKAAGLTMDVNKLAMDEEGTLNNGKSNTMNGNSKVEKPMSSQSIPPPPPPPSFTLPSERYNLSELTLNEPAGVHFSSLCYLVAMGLRGTRRQRLQLLFFLFLPHQILGTVLASHPVGGLPTWLLEIDGGEEVILSLDSLSYYYWYEGVLMPEYCRAKKRENDDSASGHLELNEKSNSSNVKRTLAVDAKSAVEILATLLSDTFDDGTLDSSFSSERGATKDKVRRRASDYGTRGLSKLLKSTDKEKEDHPAQIVESQTLTKALGVNEMLQLGWMKNSSPHEMERISKFLSVSSASLEDSSTPSDSLSLEVGRKVWSLNDFMSWANEAIDDWILDSVMRRLFSTGILPCPKVERKLVIQRWLDWGLEDSDGFNSESDKGEVMSQARGGLRKMFGHHSSEYVQEPRTLGSSGLNRIWGGIGGADGKGGLGNGVLYCIDKLWWDDWVAYTGWQFGRSDDDCVPTTLKRPRELSTERLLDRSPEAAFVSGTKGSYELMKSGLQLRIDYILIPPGVWNVLYEMYGGGPPLPRMVLPNENNETNINEVFEGVVSVENECVEIVSPEVQKPTDIDTQCPVEIPRTIRVVTHPWVLHCQICDPQQPYRRGDAGPMSIRIMATSDQPLWRLFSEIVVRLPISHSKARDGQGEGRARLWKFDFVHGKAPSATGRYGPWSLLCKNRQTEIPITAPMSEKYEERWQTYADQHSVESIGLSDGMRIMYEYAIVNKDGSFSWPREAAAKATRLSRIADEDAAFRCFLRGVDTEGKPLTVPILKKLVDAMDTSGRWYQAVIINTSTKTTLPEDLVRDAVDSKQDTKLKDGNKGADSAFMENTFVHVHFNDHAGDHEEWIDVKSDRLAVAGRFTADSVQNTESDADGDDTPNESKSRPSANKKKDGGDSTVHDSNGNALCLFPSYGACGLHNLGNTCYANSGWQCMSYLPLLRSYLLSGQFKISGDLNKDNPLGTGGRLLEEFSDLLRVMWSGKYGSRAPQKFRNFIGKCRPQYSGADQQDAQELLNDMIDMLHEDGNRVRKKPYVEALEDKWVERTNLPRVGHEAWRRFLRRNRSAISDLAMGQVYNRVTCPVCNHSSKNFDPFNMLSLPFPTVAEVIFQCTVVRRATAVNCPGTLLRVGRLHHPKQKQVITGDCSPPSKQLVFEQYIIPMSRLADMGDLKMKLQNVSGIPANRFRVCKKEDIVTGCGEGDNISTLSYTRVSALPDKDGPCVKLLQQSSMDDITSPMIAEIVAFELTLNLRPSIQVPEDSAISSSEVSNAEEANVEESTADEMSDDSIYDGNGEEQNKLLEKTAREILKVYGDEEECAVFDTNPTSLSKYVSRSLWPKTAKEFKLGLRVDAYDQRNHWFPGSVIEIIDETVGDVTNGENNDDVASNIKVRVHFDNFSSKWDEVHSIDSFNNGRVCPLYSHASPRSKPTEFVVHHRSIDRASKKYYLFGQSFYLQCHNEWSTARAGAHILAQASRFLESSRFLPAENGKSTAANSKIADRERQEAQKVIASIIEELIKHDKNYIESAITNRDGGKNKENQTTFDAAAMSALLSHNLSKVLPLLPFDVRVTTADSPLGTNKEETPFPFSLVRTIGNYMNARHSLVLHWRERTDSVTNFKLSKKHVTDVPRQLLYVPPFVVAHKQSHDMLNKSAKSDGAPKIVKRHPSSAHGGMHIGVCLTEFCKEQQLDATDCWRCPVCKVNREGKQSMALWNLPDLLTFHLKRFNASSRWREKITTKVDFPLTGLNMRQWCDPESPLCEENDNEAFIYDLVGVVNHYGGMTGGHYVATCKATPCSSDGSEEIAYSFNGAGINEHDTIEEGSTTSGWRLNRSKDRDISSNAAAKAASESSEPLWLQFDDDLVEPLPPRNVVSETAYVLFYRRRRMHPANIAKYSSLD